MPGVTWHSVGGSAVPRVALRCKDLLGEMKLAWHAWKVLVKPPGNDVVGLTVAWRVVWCDVRAVSLASPPPPAAVVMYCEVGVISRLISLIPPPPPRHRRRRRLEGGYCSGGAWRVVVAHSPLAPQLISLFTPSMSLQSIHPHFPDTTVCLPCSGSHQHHRRTRLYQCCMSLFEVSWLSCNIYSVVIVAIVYHVPGVIIQLLCTVACLLLCRPSASVVDVVTV